ncbi:hypothetical protein [Marinicella sp. W31]|uniref:hypothetical protein n=1 Tax=Marinicella sp. W31 TaxID=3023713 RepID=UPI0037574AD1
MKKTSVITLLLSSLLLQAYDSSDTDLNSRSNKFLVEDIGGVTTTNYDESIDGDFGDRLAPTMLSLMTESDRFIGIVGGADFDDCFQFAIVDEEVSQIILESFIVSGGNISSRFTIYTGTPPDDIALGDVVSINIFESEIGMNLLSDAGSLTPGTYTLCIIENTEGQEYQLVLVSNPSDTIFVDGFETDPTPK